ncbi:hypothetical protein [Segetibacter aerophilus]|uniref:Baseplate protein J-like domain-containing protein n=1 Tax=Segetibacter aerophilus TaxID=670293 RepID=A0A512BIX8_9BACT|nr:hypothetical protein [Segetibacter aerophilus]GEO11929.1 hypothetical protein SAE01_44250 [Segetibacter aerophilus]
MSDGCFKKNDLLIPGTRQDQRLYQALDPSYVLPDERTVANLLVFITKYAELINFYALKGPDQKDYAIEGNWQALILSDEAFNYAGISVTPYSLPNITFYRYVNLYEAGSTTAKRNLAYRVLWDIIFSVYKEIEAFYTALPVYMPLRNEIATEIGNGLVTDFGIVAGAYLNDAAAIPSLNLQVSTVSTDDEYKFKFADDLIQSGFHKLWIDKSLAPLADSWTDYVAVLKLTPGLALSFFNTAGLIDEFDRIDYSTVQLKQVFKRAFEAYVRIIAKATELLENSLERSSAHYAHHGLMLAFIKLFGILRTDMNEFTRKHLEYYYSRVLQIHPAPAVPDTAHIVFDPAKNIGSHLIKAATELNAGKDGTGKLLLYHTEDEIVINEAKVEQLKTIFIKPSGISGTIEKVTASPIANSVDGKGAAFTGSDTSWKGFGNELNAAAIGFFIASPVLHLTEGRRVLEFTFFAEPTGIAKMNALTVTDILYLFSFFCSGEKQWEELIINDGVVTDYNSELSFTPPLLTDLSFTIRLVLLAQFKPVVGYDPLVCDGNLNTIFPVVKFVLNQATAAAYEKLKDIEISKINITVTVEDITALSLQNEIGTLDPVKPVQAFGPLPKVGASFLVGHHELVHKEITLLELRLNWLGLPDLTTHYKYKIPDTAAPDGMKDATYLPIGAVTDFTALVEFIRNKTWTTLGAGNSALVASGSNLKTLNYSSITTIKKPMKRPEAYTNAPLLFETGTTDGFIRLTLKTPADAFGHFKWGLVFAAQTVALTKDVHNTLPNPPYTPLLESIKLKYVATQDIKLDVSYKPEQGAFIHLLPFGIRPTHTNALLLPAFETEKKQVDGTLAYEPVESALLIGVSHAVINQQISLLLQMNEGTEDISVDPPTIIWNYLSTSGWKNFDMLLVGDSTKNLLKSGIVKFQIPADVNTATTELPPGFTWISAAIKPDFPKYPKISSHALPKVLALFTNAVKANFEDHGNDPEHLAKALPAHTISKLYESDAAVKKVNQPYASFGGKKIESGSKFYTQVSERLRHKHRAITIWDYERLVLREFQEVYMVKCLNHTGYEVDCTTSLKKYKENIPGQVMLVPVPFVTNLQAGNIFQPTFSTAKLTDIGNFIHGDDNSGSCNKYLKPLHCHLAQLAVENPKYETIKVTCKVRVKECLDQMFYEAQLVDDLNNFLSPWITGDPGKINFGGRLHASQVVYFIEQLHYIDYLEDLEIEHKDGLTVLNTTEPSLAVATTSRSVLTSSGTHSIQKA